MLDAAVHDVEYSAALLLALQRPSVSPNPTKRAMTTLATLASTLAAATVEPLRLDGLVAATFSPFTAAGDLNVSVVPLQNAYLKATGVDWVFVGGTTGESYALLFSNPRPVISGSAPSATHALATQHNGTGFRSRSRSARR